MGRRLPRKPPHRIIPSPDSPGTRALIDSIAEKEYTRARVPLDWAMTQMNLGVALKNLGERESGTDKLDEAVAAYREALKEYTRARVPLEWAGTQMNLGNAPRTLFGISRKSVRVSKSHR